ncbi:MAG: flippase-like domain-containing protein [Actinobacteria bacterium]|nr:flippase-like domain-containing protein [Actinomycetota bacterium]
MTIAEAATPARPHRRNTRFWVHLSIGVVLAAIGLVVTVNLAGGIGDAVEALRDLDARWLLVAVGCETVSYVLLSWQLRYLAGHQADLSPEAAMRLGLVVYGLGLITPASPAEGMVLASAELRRRGLNRRRAVLALGFSEWFSTGALYLLAAVNVLFAAALGDIPRAERAPLIVVAAVIIATLAALAALLRRRSVVERGAVLIGALRPARSRKSVDERRAIGARWYAEARSLIGNRRHQTVAVSLALAAWIADALCLFFALRAAGASVDADVLLLAYTAGVIAAEVPLLPAGLGLVETAMPAVLRSFGVPYSTALAGSLAYRALGTFLPALAGALVLPSLRVVRRHPNDETSTDEWDPAPPAQG